MRVLVTYGSRMGGTAEIAQWIARSLEENGIHAIVESAAEAGSPEPFDAVIVGGGLYANRWQKNARRYVKKWGAALSRRPVWFFSSGPLDESAHSRELPPPQSIRALIERIGARGHITFGGRLPRDAQGFIASMMAKTHAGDWRNEDDVRAWATRIAFDLERARVGERRPHFPPQEPASP